MAHRVLVFGSRGWRDEATIRRRLERFPPGTVVIHGAASGADRLAAKIAQALGFECVVEPVTDAEWKSLGKRAGPIRNQRMLDLHRPTCGLGFVVGWTPGSADMLQRLVNAGLPVDLCSRPARETTP